MTGRRRVLGSWIMTDRRWCGCIMAAHGSTVYRGYTCLGHLVARWLWQGALWLALGAMGGLLAAITLGVFS